MKQPKLVEQTSFYHPMHLGKFLKIDKDLKLKADKSVSQNKCQQYKMTACLLSTRDRLFKTNDVIS